MQRSDHRILTTHAGSLPRPPALVDLLRASSRWEHVDGEARAVAVANATREAVLKQAAAGIDIANDGEQARESFFTYVQHRMDGFGGHWRRVAMQDMVLYPSFVETMRRAGWNQGVSLGTPPECVGPVAYSDAGRRSFAAECDAFDRALAISGASFESRFMTAPSPGIVACAMRDTHYGAIEPYVTAVAEALRYEYEGIAARGYLLQLDAPDLAMERHTLYAHRPESEFLAFVDYVIDAINLASAAVPAERKRLHVCWGNYEGPHELDIPLRTLLPHLYRADVGALMISMANPRHAHEYRLFRELPLPPGVSLIAGVIDTTTNYVEHPEVVADRIVLAAEAVGDPHRVLAGTDCGFDTSAGFGMVAEEVVWAKLRSLSAGAAIASHRLFGS